MTNDLDGPARNALPQSILLVEDNAMIAMNTEALLLDLGVKEVFVASNVAQALAFIDTQRFAFAILDFQLGDGENSLPIAARLAELGTSVAFATGFGDVPVISETFGHMPILKKPYSFEDLDALLKAAAA